MTFTSVPSNSKKMINRAGKILLDPYGNLFEYETAMELANRWRACHAYPINTFQATLRTKLKNYPGNPIVAQRLKRMPTIIDKLRRHASMELTTMQDIGGIRAILDKVEDVFKLAKDYQKNKRLPHELVSTDDYISSPRDEDGYRSLHLIYKYKNPQAPEYDNLRLELQIRSKRQHIWATAVETMGTFLGQALKSRRGDKEWLDFFALVSHADSQYERQPPINRFEHLDIKQTYLEIAKAEADLSALEMMKGISVAVNSIVKNTGTRKINAYHLVILNSKQKTVEIIPYDRNSFEQAISDYSRIEAEAAAGRNVEPVLVSAGPIDNLRRAYPNFFLDISDFIKSIEEIVANA